MRRLFYKGLLQDEITITGGDAHHLMHVMRAKPGQEVIVVDDENQVGRMKMTAFTESAVTMQLVERLEADTESPLTSTLAQCLLKADKMDFVVQKAVELGVNRIIPIASRNVVVRYDAKKAKSRQERWQKIADEAAKQCGRTALVTVEPIADLTSFLTSNAADGKLLFCYENEEQTGVKTQLRAAKGNPLTMLIGPEGGFTLAEAEAVMRAGGTSVTLGPRILRAETAAVTALTIAQYECGDLSGSEEEKE